MSSFWERLLGRRDETSAEAARERLKLVLVTDRSELSPEKLAQMQAEIIDVIKRYLNIDDADVKIKLEQRARENYLVADIPLVRNVGNIEISVLGNVDAPPEAPTDDAKAPEASAAADTDEVDDSDDAGDADAESETASDAGDSAEDKPPAASSDDTNPTPPKPRSRRKPSS